MGVAEEGAGPGDWGPHPEAAITDRRPPGRPGPWARPGSPRSVFRRLELGDMDMKLAKGFTSSLPLTSSGSLTTGLGSSLTGSRMDMSAALSGPTH